MYFPDMSVYPNVLDSTDLLTVGWLDANYTFAQGNSPVSATDKLRELLVSKRDINKMRGFHVCEFCANRIFGENYAPATHDDFREYMDKTTIYLEHGNKKILLGMSEIWIPSSFGIIYAAPSLIYHYITAHCYLPPQAFLDAVEAFDLNSAWDGEAEVKRFLIRQS